MATTTSDIMLDPQTGQYYTIETSQVPVYNSGIGGYIGMGGFGYAPQYKTVQTRKNTGDISMVWKNANTQQPFQYNVPTIAQMFPSLLMPSFNAQPIFNQQPSQYLGGAGQFLGGLLGSGGAGQFTNSAGTSGAGRFA